MEAKGIRLQGELGISRQTIAQGMPACSGCTCMLVCALPRAHCTRDRGCSKHPAFPAPSRWERKTHPNLGRRASRECETAFTVIARSECDEAIHVSASGAMDCFASLAMTWIGRGVLDTTPSRRMTVSGCLNIQTADYPCGVTEIRAQSRRPISTQSWVLRRSAMLTASQMPMAVSATVNASAATLASMR